eukprot:9483329-Pyramimonas_sp.AAC.1
MDSRWVIRWKKQTDGKLAVEARLRFKGFKDRQQDRRDTFSATASRQSQRIVKLHRCQPSEVDVVVLRRRQRSPARAVASG